MSMIDVHALLLLLLPVATFVLIRRLGFGWSLDPYRLVACVVAVAAWMLVRVLSTALTPWYPNWQWLIPGICIVAVILCIESFDRAAWTAIVIGILGIGLVEHAWSLSRSSPTVRRDYSPRYNAAFDGAKSQDVLLSVEESLRESPPNTARSGWIEDLAPEIRNSIDRTYLGETTPRIGRRWHTWLTGIRESVGSQQLGIWRSADGKLEIRERVPK